MPPKLPALLYAADVLRQLRKHKLLAPESACTEAIHARTEGLDELTAGQILFILAGACEQSGIDPETALRTYASKVESDILKLNPVTD
ncbi:MAG: hypothetical protein LR015_14105 [Verrucomicrobia bacterium]|nr:hypothetical protein [Verrucomicrobiota bacterium]